MQHEKKTQSWHLTPEENWSRQWLCSATLCACPGRPRGPEADFDKFCQQNILASIIFTFTFFVGNQHSHHEHSHQHDPHLSLALLGQCLLFQFPKVGQESQKRRKPCLQRSQSSSWLQRWSLWWSWGWFQRHCHLLGSELFPGGLKVILNLPHICAQTCLLRLHVLQLTLQLEVNRLQNELHSGLIGFNMYQTGIRHFWVIDQIWPFKAENKI